MVAGLGQVIRLGSKVSRLKVASFLRIAIETQLEN
jgi:hypothetical protein